MPRKVLSPHIQIYRMPFTAVTSILHRATGIVLSAALIILVLFLVAAAEGPESFLVWQTAMTSWVGKIFLTLVALVVVYHSFNGVRHLVWDSGKALDLNSAERAGWIVVAATIITTLLMTVGIWF